MSCRHNYLEECATYEQANNTIFFIHQRFHKLQIIFKIFRNKHDPQEILLTETRNSFK